MYFLSVVSQNVLRRRDAIQMEYEMTHEELNKKKDEREQVSITLGVIYLMIMLIR